MRDILKSLIYVGVLSACSVMNTYICKLTGIQAYFYILLVAEIYLVRKIFKKWDERQEEKWNRKNKEDAAEEPKEIRD